MKKALLAAAVVATLGFSNMCDAAFGVPKVPGPKAEKKTEAAASAVDLTNLTQTQALVLNNMAAAYYNVANANVAVQTALGNDKEANKIIAAKNALAKAPNNGNLKKLQKINEATKVDSAKLTAISQGSEVQKANLKTALEDASAYKFASYINFASAAALAPGMVKEATSLSSSVKDLSIINKLKGIIDTGNMAGTLFNATKENFAALDKQTADVKQVLGVTEASADSAKAKELSKAAGDNFKL